MRLAFDATSLLGPRTGVGTFTAEVLGRLATRPDIDVTAFAVTWRGRGDFPGAVPAGVAAIARPLPARLMRAAWRHAELPPLEWIAGRFDAVHGPNFVVPPSRRAARLVTVHDLTCVRYPQLVDAYVARYPALLRRAVARGAHVHTVSSFVASEVIETFGVPPDRVHTVANGVVDVAGGSAGRGQDLAGASRYVLALGTIEPRKDFPLLVGAFDELASTHDDLRLVVAGPDGWGANAFAAAVAAARNADRIVRLGWVDGPTRADLLAGAAAFAYPSVYEGFGLPPLEAMAAGVPVVTTRAGALPEVVGDAALLVDPGDRVGLAEALGRVIDDEALRHELVTNGRARAARYRWDDTAVGLVDIYRALAANR